MANISTKKLIKFTIALVISVLLKNSVQAQTINLSENIPLDIAYFRTDKQGEPIVKAIYGRPTKIENKVFGKQIPLNKVWSIGDSKPTEIRFYENIVIGNTTISAGTYALFVIPRENEWEIIVNSNLDGWGGQAYNSLFDLARISVPVTNGETLDVFSIWFSSEKDKVEMIIAWDNVRVKVPFHVVSSETYALLNKHYKTNYYKIF